MVVALGPGKFYSSSLQRPRFYTNVKFNNERIFKRSPIPNKSVIKLVVSRREEDEIRSEIDKTLSPPRAPVAIKRRQVVGLLDEDGEDEVAAAKRGPVRKLGDDFERVARESGMASNAGGESGGAAAAARTRK
ncbi:uncharacterized protein LOC131008381 [Salvia miltiorrhiza]|uniref:uncharacterized protein LOC131008381 n=1 Tax=Salvia miltiorrhiza TaxID=226208 RepID=UPI0025AD48D0|nr:uncharacterized protein LOC131008381 [Salvia miltiorrhiza]